MLWPLLSTMWGTAGASAFNSPDEVGVDEESSSGSSTNQPCARWGEATSQREGRDENLDRRHEYAPIQFHAGVRNGKNGASHFHRFTILAMVGNGFTCSQCENPVSRFPRCSRNITISKGILKITSLYNKWKYSGKMVHVFKIRSPSGIILFQRISKHHTPKSGSHFISSCLIKSRYKKCPQIIFMNE